MGSRRGLVMEYRPLTRDLCVTYTYSRLSCWECQSHVNVYWALCPRVGQPTRKQFLVEYRLKALKVANLLQGSALNPGTCNHDHGGNGAIAV